MTEKNIIVQPSDAGLRLDKFLALHCGGLSRARLQNLIQQGHVTSNGKPVDDAARKTKPGEEYHVHIPKARPVDIEAQDIPLEIMFEDSDLVVLNKPAGLVVHPAAGNHDRTLVNALLAHCGASLSGIGGEKRPGIVHRLDKDTSGVMVVAKNDEAHGHLSQQFAAHSISRRYQALVWGVPKTPSGRLDTRIGRSAANRKKMAVLRSGGRQAITEYKVLKNFGTLASHMECRLHTGRTHQIRVHMTHLGHGLIGDATYGRKPRSKALAKHLAPLWQFSRQALHATHLGFTHPKSGKTMQFDSPLPEDMQKLLAILEQNT